jgi:DNA uptake protein ComE-like DNA-binding protein
MKIASTSSTSSIPIVVAGQLNQAETYMRNFLLGLGIGTAVGMLVAPASGEQTRESVRDRADDLLSNRNSDQSTDSAEASTYSGILEVVNSASREDLLSIYGVGSVIADQIVQNRPFDSEQQLIDKNVVPESNFDHLKRQLGQRAA